MAVNCSLSLSATKENIWESLSLRNRSFGAVARIRLDTMSGPPDREADWPSEKRDCNVTWKKRLHSRRLQLKKRLRVEEVIARINTNVSLLERCNR